MEFVAAALFRILTRGFALLSLTGQRRLGRVLGAFAWYLASDIRRVSRRNVDLCFPDLTAAQRKCLAKRSIQQTATLLTEYGMLFHWPRERWEAAATHVEGLGLIESARRQGRGVLILVPHLGNWELLALILGRYEITALYDPPRMAAFEPLIRDARNRAGARLLPIDAQGLRAFYQALRGGAVTALLPDQVPEREAGLYAPFFGHPALTMTFAHRLISRTRPLVLMGSAIRTSAGFDVQLVEAPAEVSDPRADVSVNAMNRAVETMVRQAPTQYQWEYKRFKRPPAGSPNPYARS